ncbi:glycosyltransferase family 4 protein [Spirochaetota bacterium]
MKIGILIGSLIPGGIEKSAIEEYIYLKKQGYAVALYTLTPSRSDYQYEDLISKDDVINLYEYYPRVLRKAFNFPFFHFLNSHYLLAPFFVKKYFKEHTGDVDILLSHGSIATFSAVSIARQCDIPYVFFLWDPIIYILDKVYSYTFLRHLFWLLRPIVVHYEKNTIRYAHKVLTCSSVHAALLEERYHVTSTVIYPGCYPLEAVSEHKENYILAFTRWDHDKHPLFLLELLEDTQADLVIAGKWTNENDYEEFTAKIKQLGLEGRVTIYSYLTKEKLKELSFKALVWIHPNFEAFGMGGLEAAACGCPIIIPAGSGVTELFQGGVHGFFPGGARQGENSRLYKYITA